MTQRLYKIVRAWPKTGFTRTVMVGIYLHEVRDWCRSEYSKGIDWIDGYSPMTEQEIKDFRYRYRGYKDEDL